MSARETHGSYIAKKIGGWGDMNAYERAFGSFKFPTPSKEIFELRNEPPTLDDIEHNYGNSIYFGLRAMLAASKRSGRGKGEAFAQLASQPPAGLADAAVFIAQDPFSERAQQQPLGSGDRFGYWYPCLTIWVVDGWILVPFWCPRLALAGTKCWWVHRSRVVIFVPGLPCALQLERIQESGDRRLVDSTNGKGKDSGDGVPNDDDAASTLASSENGDSEISFSSASSDGSWASLASASSDASWVALSSASSSLASWTDAAQSNPPLPAIDEVGDTVDSTWHVVIDEDGDFDC